ncbi:hypothetical protein VNI00_016459 [Paramarasmius palmivorus]|uniref:Uncharacterized protein n=1 Tax=Paramarasmius palmivorus TaxID=297713 RepID=A0AAW0BDN4_9AGAR
MFFKEADITKGQEERDPTNRTRERRVQELLAETVLEIAARCSPPHSDYFDERLDVIYMVVTRAVCQDPDLFSRFANSALTPLSGKYNRKDRPNINTKVYGRVWCGCGKRRSSGATWHKSSTYPLDLVRARLSIATASIPINALPSATEGLGAALASTTAAATKTATTNTPRLVNAIHTSASAAASAVASNYKPSESTIWGIMREEGGVRGLYRGLVATAFGVAPYVEINFAAYELLRGIITPPGKPLVARKLMCGALAGSISQTLTYPFDVLRRKMQVTGMK